MKPSYTRRYRRRSTPARTDAVFFKRESQQENNFFGDTAHDTFFQPAVATTPVQAIQRKCADCEKEDKNIQRMEDKKDDEKIMKMEDKEEEKVQRQPEKKEEEKVQRAEDKEEDKVMRMEDKEEEKVQRKEEKKEEEKIMKMEDKEEEKIQKKGSEVSSSSGKTVNNYIGSLSGKGQPLPAQTNYFFSSKIGYDFSDVKIHKDKDATQSAKAINAKAYTIGNNVVFNEGQYNTESAEGKKLMAHELAHVVQQNDKKGSNINKKIFRSVTIQSPYDKTDDYEPSVQYHKQSPALGHTDPILNSKTQKSPSESDAADFLKDSLNKPVFSERNLDDISRPDLSDSSLDPVRANWVELEKGSQRVKAVRLVQEALVAWGRGLEDPVELLPVWGADGNFKNETKGAVEFFQTKHPGLVKDGVVGDKTLGELQKEMDNLHGRIFTLQAAGANAFQGLVHIPPAPSKWLNVSTTPKEFDTNKSVLLAHRNMVAIHLMKECKNVSKLLVKFKANGDVPGSILTHERVHEKDQVNTIKKHLVSWDAEIQMAQQLGFKTKASDQNEAAALMYAKFGIATPKVLAKRIMKEWKAGNKKFHDTPEGGSVITGLDTPDCKQVILTFSP